MSRLWLFALVLVASVYGLGSPVPSPQPVLFVVSGGWASCTKPIQDPSPVGMGTYAQFLHLWKALHTQFPQTKVHYILTCVSFSAPAGDSPIWYIRSDEPKNVREVPAKTLPQLVRDFQERLHGPRTYFIGHSYGGALLMELLQSPTSPKVAALYTLDPISTKDCEFMDNLLDLVPGCMRAPRDLNNSQIRKNTGRWINIFQSTEPLHSSKIPEAQNYELRLLHYFGRVAHSLLGRESRVWVPICKQISADLGDSVGAQCTPIQVNSKGQQVP